MLPLQRRVLIAVLIGAFPLLLFGCGGEPHVVGGGYAIDEAPLERASSEPMESVATSSATGVEVRGYQRDTTGAHLDTALAYVGTTEVGDNRGPVVREFLESVGLGVGNPYCSAYVSYCLEESKPEPEEPTVRSALAQDFVTRNSIDADVARRRGHVPQGAVFIYQKGNGPYGHNGFVQHWEGRCGRTVEANTSKGAYGNQRDGQGIWERKRCFDPGAYFHLRAFTIVSYNTQ